MADFVQTMKDWKRMCNAMGKEDEYTACDKCKLRSFGCPAIYEKECDGADWTRVEDVVATWAAENPEPVYPTWFEWLEDVGIVSKAKSEYSQIYDTVLPTRKLFDPIPADIAEKLGIEPKEG